MGASVRAATFFRGVGVRGRARGRVRASPVVGAQVTAAGARVPCGTGRGNIERQR